MKNRFFVYYIQSSVQQFVWAADNELRFVIPEC